MNDRLGAFSDGVFAIAITILVLEIKVPPLESVRSVPGLWLQLVRLWPAMFALCLSFMTILISWVGHHNYVKMLDKTSPQFQFANGFFLFTVMLYPFPTAFMAEYLNTPFAQPAIVVYCLNGILHNIGWITLYRFILKPEPLTGNAANQQVIKKAARAVRSGFVIYLAIALLAWWLPYVAIILSLLSWIFWLYVAVSPKGENELQADKVSPKIRSENDRK